MGGLSAQLLLSGTRVLLSCIEKSDEKQPRLESSSRDRSSSESIVKSREEIPSKAECLLKRSFRGKEAVEKRF